MPTFEHRKLFRTNIILKVVYNTLKEPPLKKTAFSKNISSTGINIITSEKLEKGTQLEIQIFISERESVGAKGEIIWQAGCSFIPASKRRYYTTGIQLVYMSSQDAIKTSDFVREMLRKQSEIDNKNIIEMIEGLNSKHV